MNKNNVINFIIFQINWAICVFAAAKGYPWLGPMIVFIWCLIHTYIYRLFRIKVAWAVEGDRGTKREEREGTELEVWFWICPLQNLSCSPKTFT